jgi:hypothetical protein
MATWLISTAAFLVITVLGGAVLMALRKPFAEEIGHQIDRFPERLFFVALRFFPEDERERRYDQWAEDYQELSDAYENRTLVRIIRCTRFSLSLVMNSGAIRRAASQNAANPTDRHRLMVAADRIMNWTLVLVGGATTIYAIATGDNVSEIADYAIALLMGLASFTVSRQIFRSHKALRTTETINDEN